MLSHLLLVSTVALQAFAWDSSYPIYCNETQDGPCITRLSDKCYACIHPIEAACPGTDKDFLDCLCPIPSASWTAIEKCFNDPATGCNDGATGATSEVFALLNAFAVECNGYNQFICEQGAKLDNVEQTLSIIEDCTATPAASTSQSTAPSTASGTTTTTKSQTATTTATQTKPTGSGTHSQGTTATGTGTGSSTSAPTTTSSVPHSNSGAATANSASSGLLVVALMVKAFLF